MSLTEQTQKLKAEVLRFSEDLSLFLSNYLKQQIDFEVQETNRGVALSFPEQAIELKFRDIPSGQPASSGKLLLKVFYLLTYSSRGYFAVSKSEFHLLFIAPGTANIRPVFRYEYEYDKKKYPGAHLQFHLDIPDLEGMLTQDAKARKAKAPDRNLFRVHFPVGGHRFRPSLEEFLRLLVTEFAIDHDPMFDGDLRARMIEWRIGQTKGAVEDAPSAAAEVLRAMGYAIEWQGPGPEPSVRLHKIDRH